MNQGIIASCIYKNNNFNFFDNPYSAILGTQSIDPLFAITLSISALIFNVLDKAATR